MTGSGDRQTARVVFFLNSVEIFFHYALKVGSRGEGDWAKEEKGSEIKINVPLALNLQ